MFRYIYLTILVICLPIYFFVFFIPDIAKGDFLWVAFELMVIYMYIFEIKRCLKKTRLIEFFKKEKRKIEEEKLEICETCEGDCSWMHPYWRFRVSCPVCNGRGVN